MSSVAAEPTKRRTNTDRFNVGQTLSRRDVTRGGGGSAEGKRVKSPRWLINSCLYCSGPPTDELFRPLRRNFRKFFVRASCGRVEPCIRKVGGGGRPLVARGQ